jgi:hypothetical protein
MTKIIERLVEFEEIGDQLSFPPNYIFQSVSNMISFVIIQEEMEQLHEYCILCQDATDKKLNSIQDDLSNYQTGKEVVEDPELGDVTCYVLDGLTHVDLPRWSDTQEFLVKAMCLLLLSSLLERSLKSLSSDFSPNGTEIRLPKNSVSKISAYVRYLQENCSLSFDEPEQTIAVRENCRRIRNDFAHGDWDAVRRHITGQSLCSAFDACSTLFREVEAAYMALDR